MKPPPLFLLPAVLAVSCTHAERLYYWERNATTDAFLREKLGLQDGP